MSGVYRYKTDMNGDNEAVQDDKKKLVEYIKHKVLVICSRGIASQQRHLMQDIVAMLPHCKKESKLDQKSNPKALNEIADLYNCDQILYFEIRRYTDLYTWISTAPNGPCIKFLIQNIHTMNELNMTGNCLKGSRPLLSFDKKFELEPHLRAAKQALTNVFSVPKGSRNSKPFIDHVLTFTIADQKIWFRNYQIVENENDISLVEIGPRFVMTIVLIMEGSFGGSVIYKNDTYSSPSSIRALANRLSAEKLKSRREKKLTAKKIENEPDPDDLKTILKANLSPNKQ